MSQCIINYERKKERDYLPVCNQQLIITLLLLNTRARHASRINMYINI